MSLKNLRFLKNIWWGCFFGEFIMKIFIGVDAAMIWLCTCRWFLEQVLIWSARPSSPDTGIPATIHHAFIDTCKNIKCFSKLLFPKSESIFENLFECQHLEQIWDITCFTDTWVLKGIQVLLGTNLTLSSFWELNFFILCPEAIVMYATCWSRDQGKEFAKDHKR